MLASIVVWRLGAVLLLFGCGPSVPGGDGSAGGSSGSGESEASGGASMSAGGPGSLDASGSATADPDGSSDGGPTVGCVELPPPVATALPLPGKRTRILAIDVDGDAATRPDFLGIVDSDHFDARVATMQLDALATTLSPVSLASALPFRSGGDARGDVAVPTTHYVYVFEGDGAGGFSLAGEALHLDPMVIGPIAVGDFDTDGRDDIAVLVGNDFMDGEDKLLMVVYGTSTGLPVHHATLPVATAGQLLSTDFNGDGRVDLVGSRYDDVVLLALVNEGGGGLTEIASAAADAPPWIPIGVEWEGAPGVAAITDVEGPRALMIWRGAALEEVTSWPLVAAIDAPLATGQAELRGDGSRHIFLRDIDELVLIGEHDGEPCEQSIPLPVGGSAAGAIELDGTPGLELVVATGDDDNPVTILDFTP